MTTLVLCRVLLSVSASALQKRMVLGGLSVTALWLTTYGLMCIPAILGSVAGPRPVQPFIVGLAAAAGLLDGLGNLAMVASLRASDLSVFAPLNAFRPVLALVFGWVFLAETPTLLGLAGIGVTTWGATIVLRSGPDGDPSIQAAAPPSAAPPRPWAVGLAFRLLGLALSLGGAVLLKRAAGLTSAGVVLGWWTVGGLSCVLAVALGRGGAEIRAAARALRTAGPAVGSHAGVFFAMQWSTILIFQDTLLAYSFVYFQLGTALQVVVGRVLFGEPAFPRRLAGALIMGLGSALVLYGG